jgi:AcrR family transcriptional regulator
MPEQGPGAMTGQTRKRRSQQERTAETRTRLLVATIDLLHDKGLAHTSTNDIAEAAGVSRGALTHHFQSREDLVTSAIEHMLSGVTVKLRDFTHEFALGEASVDELVDFLWGIMANRLFYVTLEYLPEARHNDMFRERLVPVVSDWHAALDGIWNELSLRYRLPPGEARSLMNATMCVVRGMIAQTILRDDPRYYADLLEFWKASIRTRLAIAAGRPVESTREAPDSKHEAAESLRKPRISNI